MVLKVSQKHFSISKWKFNGPKECKVLCERENMCSDVSTCHNMAIKI